MAKDLRTGWLAEQTHCLSYTCMHTCPKIPTEGKHTGCQAEEAHSRQHTAHRRVEYPMDSGILSVLWETHVCHRFIPISVQTKSENSSAVPRWYPISGYWVTEFPRSPLRQEPWVAAGSSSTLSWDQPGFWAFLTAQFTTDWDDAGPGSSSSSSLIKEEAAMLAADNICSENASRSWSANTLGTKPLIIWRDFTCSSQGRQRDKQKAQHKNETIMCWYMWHKHDAWGTQVAYPMPVNFILTLASNVIWHSTAWQV